MIPLWKFFIEKRQFTLMLMAVLVIAGTFSAVVITKESSPEVQIPVGIVTVALPGASAEDIERLVTNKIEEHVANISGLNTLTSTSRSGFSTVVAEFIASADIEESIQKLKDEVDIAKVELPQDATEPSVSELNFVDQPIQIISITADAPYGQLAELGDRVKDELQAVGGISRVEISGVRHREIQVVVNKEALERYSISLSQVVSSLAASNASLPVGDIVIDNISYSIGFKGSLDEVEDIGSIAVLSANGQVLYLRDIATVSDGIEKATSYSRVAVNGKPSEQALTLAVFKIRGEDVTAATAQVRERLDELKDTLLADSEVVITYDTGELVQTDLIELGRTGLITVTLVMLCLFATLGWREAIIAGLAIPLSFLIAFVGLLYSGNTINFVSLFSLILAIGILVDSGIVVVEAIHTRATRLGDKREAAFETLREYAWPLIAGTMTTVAMFVPLFFISGIVGKFIASIPFTVIFVLLASIFVALGLIPVLAIMFLKINSSSITARQEAYTEAARTWYSKRLAGFFKDRRAQRYFLLAIVVGFFLSLSLPIVGLLKVNFFPQEDLDFLYVDIEMPAGTTLEGTDFVTRSVEETLYGTSDIGSLVTSVGGTSSFGTNPQNGARYGNLTINLSKDRERSSSEVLEEVSARVQTIETIATVRAGQPSGGPPVGAPIVIKFLGEDRDSLDEALRMGRAALERVPGVIDIDASNKNDGVEFTLAVDRARLAELGVTPASIASTLRTAIAGTEATSLTGGERDIDIVVRLNLNEEALDPHQAAYTNLDSIRQIPIQTPGGQTVLLGSVLESGIGRSDAVINHEGRQRVVTLSASLLPTQTALEALRAFEDEFEGTELPASVTMEIGGENDETTQSFKEMGYALIAGLALMFMILVLEFNSFRFTTYLLSAVPLSLIGVFGGLALSGQTLSFPSLLGIIALAGVIINHAIILMDSVIQRIKVGEGRLFSDIVIEAAVSRLRPIILTTLTTVLGMVPLIFVSELWGPLAFTILFGLSFATILTLVLIPMLIYRWPGKLPTNIRRD